MRDLSVLIPIYNSSSLIRENVYALIQAFSSSSIKAEILLCDDASRDESPEILRQLTEEADNIRVFFNKRNQGLGYTLRKLIDKSSARKLIYCDIDLPFGAQGVVDVFRRLNDADIVVASRYANCRNQVGFLRKALSRLYWVFCRILFGITVTDIGSGTVGFQQLKIEQLNLKSEGFDVHLELYAKAHKAGFTIKETGLKSSPGNAGSFSILKHTPKILKNTIRWWWVLRINNIRPQ